MNYKQEKLNKDGNGIAKRLDELGLPLSKVRIIDWNPMFVILLYDEHDTIQSKNKGAPNAPDR